MKNDALKYRLILIADFLIFGTVGLFRRQIGLSSGLIALSRAAIGALVLLLTALLRRKKPDKTAIRRNLATLLVSGAMIGFNWILLFEAINRTTVAVATLCYYMAPMLVLLAAPVFLKEKLTPKKCVCAAVAFAGMILVSGAGQGDGAGEKNAAGILFGLGAALLYAGVMILNKKICGISAEDRTLVQMASAAAVMLPYTALTGGFGGPAPDLRAVLLLLTVGVVHTGLAYALFFSAMDRLPAQTCAIFSYIDPVTALLLSALVLREPLTPAGAAGAVLILGAALLAETGPRADAAPENKS